MRSIGAALGVPRHPIDVGYDVDTVAAEVNEFNWYNTSKADGGSGICQGSKTTRCLSPLNPRTGWDSYIVPGQVRIIVAAMLNNDPRPFFMHQSNLTGDRIGYAVMDGVLSAYRAVYGASAPIVNLPMFGGGAALHDQSLWGQVLHAGRRQRLGAGRHRHHQRAAGHAGARDDAPGDDRPWARCGLRQPVRRRAIGVPGARLATPPSHPQLGSVPRRAQGRLSRPAWPVRMTVLLH